MKYAEDLPYWNTSKSSPDVWLNRAAKIIKKLGGEVHLSGIGTVDGRSAFIILCNIGGDNFRIAFPVVRTKSKSELSAKRQAATMLYHDVKARFISAEVLGTRSSFLSFLQLPDGRTASEVSNHDLLHVTGNLFALPVGEDYVDIEEVMEETFKRMENLSSQVDSLVTRLRPYCFDMDDPPIPVEPQPEPRMHSEFVQTVRTLQDALQNQTVRLNKILLALDL